VSTFDSVNDPFELLCHDQAEKLLRRRMRNFKSLVNGTKGIICFSQCSRSPVQWAHYANRHTGMCLGFDVPDEVLSAVTYVKDRLGFRMDEPWASQGDDPRISEAFLTKYEHWSYEQEVRMFGDLGSPDPTTGLYFCNFDARLALREVAVGYSSPITKADILAAIGDLQAVDVYRMRPAFKSFSMVRDLSKTNW